MLPDGVPVAGILSDRGLLTAVTPSRMYLPRVRANDLGREETLDFWNRVWQGGVVTTTTLGAPTAIVLDVPRVYVKCKRACGKGHPLQLCSRDLAGDKLRSLMVPEFQGQVVNSYIPRGWSRYEYVDVELVRG